MIETKTFTGTYPEKQPTVSGHVEPVVSCDLQIEIVCDFVKAYEKEKYRVIRKGGNLKSVTIFMVEYCEKLRAKSN